MENEELSGLKTCLWHFRVSPFLLFPTTIDSLSQDSITWVFSQPPIQAPECQASTIWLQYASSDHACPKSQTQERTGEVALSWKAKPAVLPLGYEPSGPNFTQRSRGSTQSQTHDLRSWTRLNKDALSALLHPPSTVLSVKVLSNIWGAPHEGKPSTQANRWAAEHTRSSSNSWTPTWPTFSVLTVDAQQSPPSKLQNARLLLASQ